MNEDKMELEEAIKQCEKFIKAFKEDDTKSVIGFDVKAIETVLQELENTQKNHELAIKQNISYKQNIQDLKYNSIPKKKIEDKKQWLEENILQNDYANDLDKDIAEYQVDVLQELLEEEV